MTRKTGITLFTILECAGIVAALILKNFVVLTAFMAVMLLVLIVSSIVDTIHAPKACGWKSRFAVFLVCAVATVGIFYAITEITIPWFQRFKTERTITGTYHLLIESSEAKVYWDDETLNLYTLTEQDGKTCFNKTESLTARDTELDESYSTGYEMKPPLSTIVHLFVRPASVDMVSCTEYIVTYEYQNNPYIAHVYIPGIIDIHQSQHNPIIGLKYAEEESERDFKVSLLAREFLIQSNVCTFNCPCQEMDWNGDQLFSARFNDYLRFMGDVTTNISDSGVQLIRSFSLTSGSVETINFYAVGYLNRSNKFVTQYTAMEVVFRNGRCKIGVVKDFDPASIQSVVDMG